MALNEKKHSPDISTLGAAGWREGFGLVGVIFASIISSWIILGDRKLVQENLLLYVIGFSTLVLIGILALILKSPPQSNTSRTPGIQIKTLLKNAALKNLFFLYFFNSLSVSIPATLILFFINDQIQASEQTGVFLASYFFAAAIGLPFWIFLARKIGCKAAWKLGMLIAVLSFFGAAFLGKGDAPAFILICMASGFALGADLALPPVMLAELIPKEESVASYFGVWSLLGKLALAVSGLSLPLLSLFHYSAKEAGINAPHNGHLGLVITYALIPCFFKLLAFYKLHRQPS
jgi:GPH family glycoside/pentoside/hexuronide:cation symporter